jgi:hypothetical protein
VRVTGKFATAALVAAGILASGGPAAAALISGTYTAKGDFAKGNTIDLSFTITFNNSADIAETTSNITLTSLVISGTTKVLTSAFGFIYNAATDSLTIGGLQDGVDGIPSFDGTSVDFVTRILNASSSSLLTTDGVGWTVESRGLGTANPLTVTFTPSTTVPVPEPASALVLGAGLLGLGAARRRPHRAAGGSV